MIPSRSRAIASESITAQDMVAKTVIEHLLSARSHSAVVGIKRIQ